MTDDIVEKLVEGRQLFTNVHPAISFKRRFEINPHLSRSVAIKASLDDYLFGSEFLSKVKTNKEMEKTISMISMYKTKLTRGDQGIQKDRFLFKGWAIWSPIFNLQTPSLQNQNKTRQRGADTHQDHFANRGKHITETCRQTNFFFKNNGLNFLIIYRFVSGYQA